MDAEKKGRSNTAPRLGKPRTDEEKKNPHVRGEEVGKKESREPSRRKMPWWFKTNLRKERTSLSSKVERRRAKKRFLIKERTKGWGGSQKGLGGGSGVGGEKKPNVEGRESVGFRPRSQSEVCWSREVGGGGKKEISQQGKKGRSSSVSMSQVKPTQPGSRVRGFFES